jgi:hypothetical protein
MNTGPSEHYMSYVIPCEQLVVIVQLVFKGPVWSGLLALSAMDQDHNRLTAV